MSDKSGSARSASVSAEAPDLIQLASALGEIRRQVASEVKMRRDVIKPPELALRALKDPHRSAVVLHEATDVLQQTPPELPLPKDFGRLVGQLRELADAKLSELEFTFARDLRAAFTEQGLKLEGPPAELIAD